MPQRILIAEDDASIVASLEFLMRRSGFVTRTAGDGRDALAQIGSFRPHLVILDLMLPHLSGLEICAAIRERAEWRSIRVLMLTARGGVMESGSGLAAGADDCLAKPFATQELVARVRSLLGADTPPGAPPGQTR